jgi:hypothetical protein
VIKPEQIPDEVVEAFVDAYYAKDMTRKAAIAAAINSWPGAQKDRVFLGVLLDGHDNRTTRLCLPLPKDAAGA